MVLWLDVVQFGCGMLDIFSFLLKLLICSLVWFNCYVDVCVLVYDGIYGLLLLCEEVVCLLVDFGCWVIVSDVVIIIGCYEVLLVSICVVCELGDIVVVELLSFYGVM